MIIFRILGMWVLIAAVMALVVDGTKSLAANEIITTSFGELWRMLSPMSFQAAREAIEINLSPFVWDPVITAVLMWPGWLLLLVLGWFLTWLGRPRHRTTLYVN